MESTASRHYVDALSGVVFATLVLLACFVWALVGVGLYQL